MNTPPTDDVAAAIESIAGPGDVRLALRKLAARVRENAVEIAALKVGLPRVVTELEAAAIEPNIAAMRAAAEGALTDESRGSHPCAPSKVIALLDRLESAENGERTADAEVERLRTELAAAKSNLEEITKSGRDSARRADAATIDWLRQQLAVGPNGDEVQSWRRLTHAPKLDHIKHDDDLDPEAILALVDKLTVERDARPDVHEFAMVQTALADSVAALKSQRDWLVTEIRGRGPNVAERGLVTMFRIQHERVCKALGEELGDV